MKNKVVGIALVTALVLGFGVSSTFASSVEKEVKVKPKYQQEFHVGEKPLKTWKDKDTGVVVEMFESFPESTGSMMTTLSAGWDLVGSDWWTMNGNWSDVRRDETFYSTGGDYMFRIPAHTGYGTASSKECFVRLQEFDEGDEIQGYVTSWTVTPASVSYDYIVRDIGNWVDGTNEKAEFFTTHRTNYYVTNNRLDYVNYYD